MKKFFSMLSLAAVMLVAVFAATPQVANAGAYIDIDMQAEFFPDRNEVHLWLTATNTGDEAADVDGLSIFTINVYDDDGNVIWASKRMVTNDNNFPKFHIEPGETVQNIWMSFDNAANNYCGDMINNPYNYTGSFYPVDWDGEVRFY